MKGGERGRKRGKFRGKRVTNNSSSIKKELTVVATGGLGHPTVTQIRQHCSRDAKGLQ
jgi:hypothetical protein